MLGKTLRRLVCSAIFVAACLPCTAAVLDDLAAPRPYKMARISSNDKTGGNSDGLQTNRIRAGETRVLAQINGPGQIVHFWMTAFGPEDLDLLRDVILRIYWDGEKTPSVESPMGEFFGLGHGRYYTYESLPMAIGNNKGMNCFFPMPFRKGARITVQNLGGAEISDFYYCVDYQVHQKPKTNLLYFHAQYRQEKPILTHDSYTILDAGGRGHYVGCFLYARQNEPHWWGEGDDLIYVDGNAKLTLKGTGTEDYFCHSWGFGNNTSAMRFGAPLGQDDWVIGSEFSVYRFHLEDAIPFDKSIKVMMEHGYEETNDRSDDFSSVAYWYQAEPHAAFPRIAPPRERRSTASRMDAMLKEKRFDEYRKWWTQIGSRTPSKWMKANAEFNIANSYALEGDSGKAIKALQAFHDTHPGPDTDPFKSWRERAAERIAELGGEVKSGEGR
ncbi:MAG: DUF2961 domain-containing protein [Armatimonadota bacterium]|nr:DUF2961 domain-containing protein [Armatimonadota bacterium]